MMLIKSYVAPSGIHGNGLFAAQDIKAGDRIWEFMEGLEVLIPVAAIPGMPEVVQNYIDCYCYPHDKNPDYLVLDGDSGRFMNHSENPNSDFTPGRGHAVRDIAAGEEITCNYRDFVPNFIPYSEKNVLADILPGMKLDSNVFNEPQLVT